ncbi:ABC transporter ATP-binding protein [Sulfurimonas sp.]
MIELKNLSCSYENRTVLQNISLQIPEHISILGPNGSGKSTLAKAICQLIEYQGTIELDAKNIATYNAKQRAKKIAYIPTKLEFYDEFLSLEEFVLLGRFPHKQSFIDYDESDRNIAKCHIDMFSLSKLATHPLRSLSSGEMALGLIAQALTQESSIIIFDEPTANLDPKNAQIIAHHIKQLKQTHQTILITHDLHLAHFIDNPVLFLKEKQAHYFEKNFFNDATLSSLYDVSIQSLAVQYA